ncbi:hypothetical protein [Alteromonas sp. a30]|nr:hypothetical protein [Alteromonas sp. a30]MCY7296228.1 hypothetical protein [Alteromonas sp. a30]
MRNVEGPDALINGVNWEIKEVSGTGKHSFYDNIGKGISQFDNSAVKKWA